MRLPSAAAALALGCVALPASANGRFPEAQLIVAGRGSTPSRLAIRTTFGVVLRDGAAFRYVCEDVLGTGAVIYDPPIGLTGDGRLLSGLWDGFVRGTPDACGGARVAGLEGEAVQDLDVDPTGLLVVAVTRTGLFSGASAVYRSVDGGDTFVRAATAAETAFSTVEIAPSDLSRLWLTARTKAATTIVYRSDDGGASLVPVAPLPRPEEAYVAAVDPTNPDRVWLRLSYQDAGFLTRSAAYRTDDAGKTWSLVADVPGAMLGFAVDRTGKKVFLGGPEAGLLRAIDGGAPVSLSSAKVRCLRHHEGRLWACLGGAASTFAVAASCDDGATLPVVVDLPSLTATTGCATGTTGAACPAKLAALRTGLDGGVHPAVCDPDAGTDAGPSDGEADAPTDADAAADADAAIADSTIADARVDADAASPPLTRAGGGGCQGGAAPLPGLAATALAVAAALSVRRRSIRPRGPDAAADRAARRGRAR